MGGGWQQDITVPGPDGDETYTVKFGRATPRTMSSFDGVEGWDGLAQAVDAVTISISLNGEEVDPSDCPIELLTRVAQFHPAITGAAGEASS